MRLDYGTLSMQIYVAAYFNGMIKTSCSLVFFTIGYIYVENRKEAQIVIVNFELFKYDSIIEPQIGF